MRPKRVYFFGGGKAEGRPDQVDLLGAKGASLHQLASLGLPVPPGFTLTSELCAEYHRHPGRLPHGIMDEIRTSLRRLERLTGKKLGDRSKPLLLSVRCGAAVPMPGLMKTVLNLGLTDATAAALARIGGDRFAHDCYIRLITSFATAVAGLDRSIFSTESPEQCKDRYWQETGRPWPDDAFEQLRRAIQAALASWNSAYALAHRRKHGLDALPGVAVTIQAMVFGNLDDGSATGAAITRNPTTGEDRIHGHFLPNSQGRDFVSDPRRMACTDMPRALLDASRELLILKRALEKKLADVVDFEFTIEHGRIYVLQARPAKRTAAAAVRIAVDMARQKVIGPDTALLRVDPIALEQFLHPTFDPHAERATIARGFAASPGAAAGMIAFSAEEAEARAREGEQVILVRLETEPADIPGMHVAEGILTSSGGMTSHAAVVARGLGAPCITGATDLRIDPIRQTLTAADRNFGPQDWISIDGSTGEIYAGRVPIIEPELTSPVLTLLRWADEHRTLRVLANADTPADAELARSLGAEGIGLCRTEHMFFDPLRIRHMREMILAADSAGRQRALAELLPHQRRDFVGLFEAMDRLPVIIRLLDPPLHEFLPNRLQDQRELASSLGVPLEYVQRRVEQLREANPMLGHRGCRLCITCPEILQMQVQAIMEAACQCRRAGLTPRPKIMIPLVAAAAEVQYLAALARQTADHVLREAGLRIPCSIGTMIETPRSALLADQIAAQAEFFSFGTNDLTQMALGISRDDAGSFLPEYLKKRILDRDPFASIDQPGVGLLMQWATEHGRRTRPNLECGICGEHGGEPASIAFCHSLGLDYVSCSPFRVPVVRLAAAQVAIRSRPIARRPARHST